MSATTFDDTAIQGLAYSWFADAHPHEAFAIDPEGFWKYFHQRAPEVSRDVMEAILKETDDQMCGETRK